METDIKIMFDRNKAFQGTVGEAGDEIHTTITIEDKLLVFNLNSIHELITANKLDSHNQEPDTRHSQQKLYDIGSNSDCIARTILQAHSTLNSIHFKQGFTATKEAILSHVWLNTAYLLECKKSFDNINQQVEILTPQVNDIINKSKDLAVINSLPQVEGLDSNVSTFLNYAKRFLEKTFELLSVFYGSPSHGANFDAYVIYMKKNHSNSDINQILNEDWVRKVSHMRNALDAIHARENYKLEIFNFKLQPGNKFTAPSWQLNANDKDSKFTDLSPIDICHDMNIIFENMVSFFEQCFLICVKDNWSRFPYLVSGVDPLDEKCPQRYRITTDLTLLKKL